MINESDNNSHQSAGENNIETGLEFKARTDLQMLGQKVQAIKTEYAKVIIGQAQIADFIIAAILVGGHVLIEGVPGVAKTLSAKLIAKAMDIDFKRVQFTPDLMPSDLIGTSVYNQKESEFQLKKGPVFTNILLADEINRAPAKTQSALFEVMEEKQVTIDGITHKLDFPYIVIATQNPIEHEGTYRLPEAQIDRFIFKIEVAYPTLDEETSILSLKHQNISHINLDDVAKVINADDLINISRQIATLHFEEALMKYITQIVQATRKHKSIYLGASPRASIAMMYGSKAFAAMAGRDFVTPEDIQAIAPPVLRHRIILTSEKEMDGTKPDAIISEILQSIEIPR